LTLAQLRLLNLARFFFGALALPFAWLFVGRRPPIPVSAFLLIPAAVYLSVFVMPGERSTWLISMVFIPLTLLTDVAALVVLGRAAVADRNRGAMILLGAAVVSFTFTMRDYFLVVGLLEDRHILLTRFNGAL